MDTWHPLSGRFARLLQISGSRGPPIPSFQTDVAEDGPPHDLLSVLKSRDLKPKKSLM